MPADRPQPPRGRHGLPHRHADRRSPATRAASRRSATPLPRVLRDAGYNTFAVGKWHLVPGGERSVAGPFDRWPLGFGFERYYGFLHGDTNQWAPDLVRDNHYVEPPRTPRGRLPPHRGPGRRRRSGSITAPAAGGARPAVLPLLRAGRDARAAPRRRRSGSSRYRGRVRRRLGAVARATCSRARSRAGIVPAGTDARGRARAGSPEWATLAAATRSACSRARMEVFAGFLSHTDAQIGRVARAARRARRARRHARDADLRQRRQRRGRPARARSTSTASPSTCPTPSRATSAWIDELGGSALVPPLRVGLGVGRQHAAAAVEALHVARRHAHAAHRALAARHRRRAARCATSSCTRSTSCRRCSTPPASTRPTWSTASTQQPVDGASIRATFADADAPVAAHGAVLRDARLALDRTPTGGRRRPTTCRRAWSTRSACSRAAATSTTTAGRCSDLDDDFAEAHDVAAEHPDVLADAAGALDRGGRAQPGVPAGRRAHRPHRRGGAVAQRGPDARGLPSRGRAGARRLGGAALRRLPDGRRRSTCPTTRRGGDPVPRWATGPAASRCSCATAGSSSCSTAPATKHASRATCRSRPAVTSSPCVYTPGFAGPGVASVPRRRAGRARGAVGAGTDGVPARRHRPHARVATVVSPCAPTTSRRSRGPARCTRSSSRPGRRSSRRSPSACARCCTTNR